MANSQGGGIYYLLTLQKLEPSDCFAKCKAI